MQRGVRSRTSQGAPCTAVEEQRRGGEELILRKFRKDWMSEGEERCALKTIGGIHERIWPVCGNSISEDLTFIVVTAQIEKCLVEALGSHFSAFVL